MNISRRRKKKKNTIAAARDAFHCTRFNFSVSSFCLIACAYACVRVCVCVFMNLSQKVLEMERTTMRIGPMQFHYSFFFLSFFVVKISMALG